MPLALICWRRLTCETMTTKKSAAVYARTLVLLHPAGSRRSLASGGQQQYAEEHHQRDQRRNDIGNERADDLPAHADGEIQFGVASLTRGASNAQVGVVVVGMVAEEGLPQIPILEYEGGLNARERFGAHGGVGREVRRQRDIVGEVGGIDAHPDVMAVEGILVVDELLPERRPERPANDLCVALGDVIGFGALHIAAIGQGEAARDIRRNRWPIALPDDAADDRVERGDELDGLDEDTGGNEDAWLARMARLAAPRDSDPGHSGSGLASHCPAGMARR